MSLLKCIPSVAAWFAMLVMLSPAQEPAKPLPRVLIIGDVNYHEPASVMSKQLKGSVEIVRPVIKTIEVLNSTTALANLELLLGTGKWDLIHFNVGLGDLIYRAPGMKSFRVMPIESGGIRTTDPKAYESNLRELAKRLKATGAKIVWASTTPIRASTTNVFLPGSEIEYNAIAAKVMTENGIPINDMHTHAKSLMDMNKPGAHGIDPFYFDGKPIHEPILKLIQDEVLAIK